MNPKKHSPFLKGSDINSQGSGDVGLREAPAILSSTYLGFPVPGSTNAS